MGHKLVPAELRDFSKGIVSNSNIINAEDFSIRNMSNFLINKDKSLSRRFGLETSNEFSVPTTLTNSGNIFLWEKNSVYVKATIVCVQYGSYLYFLDANSKEFLGSTTIPSSYLTQNEVFGMASINGYLVVVSGGSYIYVVDYDGESFTKESHKGYIRDLYGVDDGLISGTDISTRPSSLSDAHKYNLLNQGFAVKRKLNNTETVGSPLIKFSDGTYPSNSDTVAASLYADADDDDDRITRRYFSADLYANPLGNVRAPMGYYIIDWLSRSSSRKAQSGITSLRKDSTVSGPLSVCSFSGRLFYAGFGVETGDSGEDTSVSTLTPKLDSCILFSQVIKNNANYGSCYQAADPTNPDDSELVDTDGGLIKIPAMTKCVGLMDLKSSLIVFGENGLWEIKGGSGYGFTASNYAVSKISSVGAIQKGSIVSVDDGILFLSKTGVMAVTLSELGDVTVSDLTTPNNTYLYESFSKESLEKSSGFYDRYNKRVYWMMPSDKEALVLDLDFKSFYLMYFYNNITPLAAFYGDSYIEELTEEPVTVNSDLVSVNRSTVTALGTDTTYVAPPLTFLVSLSEGALATAQFKDETSENPYEDTITENGEVVSGMDAYAFLEWWPMNFGDVQRRKQLQSLTTYVRPILDYEEDEVID